MPSYYRIDPLPLKAIFGSTFRPLPTEALLERLQPHAQDLTFCLTVLGLSELSNAQELAELVALRQLRGFVPSEDSDAPSDLLLTVSTVVGIVLVAVWSPQSSVDPQAMAEDLLVMADGLFSANPHCQRVVSTFTVPMSNALEETLSGWGFERVGRPCDDLGTRTWGIARDVADMVLQSLR